jgi:hypothetical protein
MTHRDMEKRRQYLREWSRKNRDKIREYARRYRARHKEKFSEYKRKYTRQHTLAMKIGSKTVHIYGLSKRPYPRGGKCELCGRSLKRLEYHHWDNYNKGVWACAPCHMFIERLEKRFYPKWIKLKSKINEELRGGQAYEKSVR